MTGWITNGEPAMRQTNGRGPPGLVMMALGSFRFGMRNDACQRFSHSAAWRWNKVDRIGREPALQYLGPISAPTPGRSRSRV